MIQARNINFATIVEVVGTTTGDDQNYAIKYADGTLICCIRKTFSGVGFSAWGSIYEHEFGSSWFGNWAVPFTEKPVVSYACDSGPYGYWVASIAGAGSTTTKPGAIDLCRAGSASNAGGTLMATGIGRWK